VMKTPASYTGQFLKTHIKHLKSTSAN
jgi:hypothetical protein